MKVMEMDPSPASHLVVLPSAEQSGAVLVIGSPARIICACHSFHAALGSFLAKVIRAVGTWSHASA